MIRLSMTKNKDDEKHHEKLVDCYPQPFENPGKVI